MPVFAQKTLLRSFIVTCLSLFSIERAFAQDDLGVARGFNAFIEQSFISQYTDIEGRLAAGGDIQLESYGVASNINVTAETLTLIAGGDIQYNNGMIFSGSVLSGGSSAGIAQNVRNGMDLGSSIMEFATLPFDFSEQFTLLRDVSQSLSLAEPTGSVNFQWGGMYLTGDCESDVQVFSIDGAQLITAHTFQVDCVPEGATIVFNIDNANPGMQNVGLYALQPRANKILWNFYEAQTVTFSSIGVEGSILAPNATLDTPWGYVNGTVMVKSWSGHMELHNVPFTGEITSLLPSEAPVIISDPVFYGTENSEYQYDVEAIDEDIGDVLTHSIDLSPLGFAIDPDTGLISWQPEAEYVGSVEENNSQCFVVPTGGISVVEEGDDIPDDRVTVISPLFKQVKEALEISAEYTARESVAWDQREGCLGCHIQTQSLLGLETSIEKVTIDETAVDYLLNELFENQQANGTITSVNHRTSLLNNQTSLALWSLNSYPDRALTLEARSKALSFFNPRSTQQGEARYWPNDHNTGWMNDAFAVTALVSQAGAGILSDRLNPELEFSADQFTVAQDFEALVPSLVEFFLLNYQSPNADVTQSAFRLIGLSELQPYVVAAEKQEAVESAIQWLDEYLRSIALPLGGWAANTGGAAGSPVASAWVGIALNYLAPPLTDPVVIKNIEYLLSVQNLTAGADYGTWRDSHFFPGPNLAATSLVMSYLPVALDFLGNPDLFIGDTRLVEQGDIVTIETIIGNRGIKATTQEAQVQIYAGASNQGSYLGSVTIPPLAAGATYTASLVVSNVSLIGTQLYLELDVPGDIEECEIRNNSRLSAVVLHRVTDRRGLFDTQLYALSVRDANAAPIITSPAEITHQQGQVKGVQVTVADEDIADAVIFSLVDEPGGVFIDERTGQILVDGTLIEPGNYSFTVQATDLRGASTTQTLSFTIEQNDPPEIISPAVQQVSENQQYLYPVEAIDPNGDELKYGVSSNDINLSINNRSGLAQASSNIPLEGLRSDNEFCEAPPVFGEFVVSQKWHWQGAGSGTRLFGPVNVVQLTDDNLDGLINSDDIPDIVMNEASTQRLIAVSGDTGEEIWRNTDVTVAGLGSPSAADIDGDGFIEIVSVSRGRSSIFAFEHTGELKWTMPASAPSFTDPRDSISIADLDQDGDVELILGRNIYDHEGNIIAQGTGSWGGDTQYGIISVAADIDLDGTQEIIAANTVYDITGATIWAASGVGTRGFNAVGNFDSDDFPEIVLVGSGYVNLLSHTGELLWRTQIPGGGQGGAPTLADFDGDGELEIGVAGGAQYALLESDGSIKWTNSTQDASSHRTGSSVFDFQGDGKAEVVYADETHFRIWDGQTGDLIFEIDNLSGTTLEYPVIADIDNDGAAEVLYGGNQGSTRGLFAIESGAEPWAPSRAIWNQHAYHITNINDDGTVPQFEQPSWLTHNTYRLNTFADRSALSQPDLAGFELNYNDSTQTLSAVIKNRGTAPTSTAATVNFYAGNPDAGGTLLGAMDVASLQSGEELAISLNGISAQALADEVFLDIQYTGGECISNNNRTSAKVIQVGVTDEGGLSDSQTYLFSVINVNDVPVIVSSANATVPAGQGLTHQVEVQDPDLGDAFFYSVLNNDPAISIGELSGVIQVEPGVLVEDTYNFTVRVEDLAGAFVEQTFVLNVTAADNLPPEFTSTPTESVAALADWVYVAQATDPDGDQINYGLDTRPTGMTIDPVTGEIYWQPSIDQQGLNIVDVIAMDERGASTHQRFSVFVSDPFVNNNPPQITSQPSGAITAGTRFVYPVIATDPDRDVLTYSLTGAVGNMSLDSTTGVFSWLPEASMVGRTFTITIKVSDGRGGFASQQISLPVNEPSNAAPQITSTPATQVLLGELYTYQISAIDADGDEISFSFGDKRPNGMTMSPSGLINWEPSAQQASQVFEVEVRATDARGATAFQRYGIAVNVPAEPNEIPYFVSAPTSPAFIGQVYSYQAEARDADNDPLTYSLVQPTDKGITVSANGLLSWSPTAVDEGEHTVAVSVTDGLATVTQTYTLAVAQTPAANTNNYPEIVSDPASEILGGEAYSYQVIANDPDGDDLTYELLFSSIEGASLTPEGLFSWNTTVEQAGIQDFKVKVSDGELSVVQSWSVLVWDEFPPLRLFLDVSPIEVNQGDNVTITVATTGGNGPAETHLFVDGFEVVLDANGRAVVTAGAFGLHDVLATADAGDETLEQADRFLVLDPSDTTAPTAIINTPDDTAVITAPTPIIGSVQDDNLAQYEVYIAVKGSQNWRLIASGTDNVDDNELGLFDPTMLLNGTYSVLLVATDNNGQTAQDNTTVIVDGEMKVGHFSITFEDVSVDLAGIPVRVTRTYDTRRKDENLDFGYGWSVDYQNVQIQESRTLGFSWQNNYYRNGFFGDWCIEANGDPVVTIRLPDGNVERFKAKADPECSSLVATVYAYMSFEPMAGTYSTLEQNDYGQLRLTNGNIVDIGDENTFENGVDPRSYTLTTKEGMIYRLDQNFGIRRIEEPGGQYVTYSDDGIVHSLGYAVDFIRDSSGRIVALELPDGRRREYNYGLMGDLESISDFSGDVTTFDYLTRIPHYLDEIVDPRGVSATRMEYDEAGRLIAMIDADGNRVEYDHDIDGRTSLIKDARGNQTLYVYDDNGRVILETNPLGETTTRSYNEVGDILTETNHLGETRSWTYDNRGNTLTETDPLGNTISYTYDDQNEIVSETNALGITPYTNTYNTRARKLTSTTDALGNTTSFHWDVGVGGSCTSGASLGYTDALGNRQTNTIVCYGPLAGTQTGMTDANGVHTSYGLDSSGRKVSESTTRTDLNGNVIELVTRYEYDAEDRITKTVHPDGTQTTVEYNNIDQVTAEIDPQGRRTEFTYDDRGQQVGVLYHDGTTETKTYDAAGNTLTETDRLGRTTTYVYDENNRQVSVTYADGSTTQTEYDAAGRVVATVDALGNRSETEYDAAGRRTLVRDAQGNETHYEYDAAGRMTAMVDALNRRVEYQYNDIDQRTATVYPDATSNTTDYDALSRKTGATDQAGVQTQYEYDPMGRLLKVVDALDQETLYGYDEQGNKISQTDALGRTTRWEYDAMGRVTKRILPLGQEETFTYNSLGLRISHTDFNGDTTQYEYDANDRVASISYADGRAESFTYDALGNRIGATQTSATGEERVTSYAYDDRNRLAEEIQADGTRLLYTYDSNGNRTQVQVVQVGGVSTTTDYTFDSLNRLVGVTTAEGITSYGYDAVGNRTSISYPNGSSQLYTYDDLNRLVQLRTFDGSGALVEQYDYSLHATGRRTAIDELDGRATAYTYDDVYRLTSEVITDVVAGDYSASFSFDAVGNRLTQTVNGVLTEYTYDDNDRLLSAGVNTYTYDANGNTLVAVLDGDTIEYSYNSKNQLIEMENSAGTTQYAYNISGIRTQAGDTQFIVDSNRSYAQVLIEERAAGDVIYSYGDDLISQTRSGETHFYHYDGLGSTRALSDELGVVSDTYDYQAFGEILNQTGATENSYLYTGEQFDSGLDQYYLRARYYDQGVGRFTQMDTWMGRNSDPVTLHKYLYANVDPANGIDPSGNMTLAGLSAGMNSAMSFTTTVFRVAQTVDKVNTFLDLIMTFQELRKLTSSGVLSSYVKDGLQGSLDNFKNVDLDDATDSLLRHSGTLLTLTLKEWGTNLTKNAKNIDRFVVYLPQSHLPIYQEIPIWKANRYKIMLVMDPKGKHRLSGMGFGLKQERQANQLWRMDYHKKHVGRNPASDAEYFSDRQFHYHVQKAPK